VWTSKTELNFSHIRAFILKRIKKYYWHQIFAGLMMHQYKPPREFRDFCAGAQSRFTSIPISVFLKCLWI
jgi:hypothetical protein